MLFYRFVRLILCVILFLRGMRFLGREKIPETGGMIVAANHMSGWDVVALGCVTNRPVHFMAKEEFFARPFTGALFKWLHAFPVKRGAPDMKAIKRALELLKAGEVVGIFPEGHRGKSDEEQEPMSGMIFLMEKADVPLVPARVYGTDTFMDFRARPGIIVGSPLRMEQLAPVETKKDRRALQAREVMERIRRLEAD
ncbi:MAG: 1-acyl-sn-glycerol-3-phosphate acyltransferase [Gracilibacteraceae bacterium]|jgi:1-acyl-sn-glycerol-3-phosphate acyltransferase|nr:1-acyl-sn-glycerol-3-phosphate acyltransferase [Gracilibacteraceae bacterium]